MHSQVDTLNAKLNDVSTQAAAAATALQQQATTQNGGKAFPRNSGRQVRASETTGSYVDRSAATAEGHAGPGDEKTAPTWKASSVRRKTTEWIDRDDARRTDCAAELANEIILNSISRKSRSFQREGPLSLSLRKADAKIKATTSRWLWTTTS